MMLGRRRCIGFVFSIFVFFDCISYNTGMQEQSSHPTVSIGEFEGPIEVLLRMIQDRKLPINDVSLASVTDEYVAYIQQQRKDDYGYITHFLYIASTLLLIKSRSLLPTLELTDEEEESIDALQLRLRLYQIFAHQAEVLRPLAGRPSMFTRPFRMRRVTRFSPDHAQMQPDKLLHAIQYLDVFHEERAPQLPEVRVRTASIHIQDIITSLGDRMKKAMSVSFNDFRNAPPVENATGKEKKVYAIVGFLAMLEMVRNGLLAAQQSETFHDIMMTSS
jgi:segregation and condensation protein A